MLEYTSQKEKKVPVLAAKEFNALKNFIYDECGIKLTEKKKVMLQSRLTKRLRILSLPDFSAYLDYLFSKEGQQRELYEFINVVTTNKTDFFREPGHFDFLTDRALHTIIGPAENRGFKQLSIWSAGCSTGEEPYTLAMVLEEYARANQRFSYKILATDISTKVLKHAHQAIYHKDRVKTVQNHYLKHYFLRGKRGTDRENAVRIAPHIRKKIRFQRVNFLAERLGVSAKQDIIFCRNVIIYFDKVTQKKVLMKLYHNLKPGGYIFLGHSESIVGLNIPLQQVSPTIYKK